MDANLILLNEYDVVDLGASVDPLWMGLENIANDSKRLECKSKSILIKSSIFVKEDGTYPT